MWAYATYFLCTQGDGSSAVQGVLLGCKANTVLNLTSTTKKSSQYLWCQHQRQQLGIARPPPDHPAYKLAAALVGPDENNTRKQMPRNEPC